MDIIKSGNNNIPLHLNEPIDCNNNSNSLKFKRPLSEYLFVLNQLNTAYNLRQRIGRRTLHNLASSNGIFLTEQQIRVILVDLQDNGFVDILTGRGGSVITKSGIEFLDNYKRV